MLQTRVGKRTGRAALRMAVDMVERADHQDLTKAEAVSADHRRAPRPGAAPPVRRLGLHRAGQGPRRRPPAPRSAGSTSPPTTPPPRPSGASRSSWSAARPRPRTCTACSPPRASSPPGAAWSATPPWWPAAGASRRWSAPRRCASRADSFTRRRRRGQRGRLDLARRHHRHGRARAGAADRGVEPPPEFDTILAWADEIRKGQLAVRANADNGAGRRQRPPASAPRASGCAGPSTCSWARTACPSCAA